MSGLSIVVNGKQSSPAPLTMVVPPFQPIPNVPPGYFEKSRWTDGTGATVLRCERATEQS